MSTHTLKKFPLYRLNGHSSHSHFNSRQSPQHLCASPVLLDGISPVLFLLTVHLFTFYTFQLDYFILTFFMWSQDTSSNSRKGNSTEKRSEGVNLKNPPTHTSTHTQPPMTTHHSNPPNMHITYWPPFSEISGKAIYCEKGRIR